MEWYNYFRDSLTEEQLKKSKEYPSGTIFKFGVGKLKAKFKADIPVNICNVDVALNVDVVDTDIPLLLSRTSMKSLGMNIDLKNDAVIINGKSFDLNVTISGHYMLPVFKPIVEKQAIRQQIEENEANKCISILGSMQLADNLIKKTANSEPLLNAISTGTFCLQINN